MNSSVLHIICFEGSCSLHFAGADYTLTRGMCLVAVETHVHFVTPSPDCRMKTLSLTSAEHASFMPDTPWGVCGEFRFFTHPLFTVPDSTLRLLERDLDEIALRQSVLDGTDAVHGSRQKVTDDSVCQASSSSDTYAEIARQKAIELFYIDLVGAHERIFSDHPVSKNYAAIMNRFISLLKNGSYVTHRHVEYYANVLCITAKHLHKVCKDVSGRAPSYWIQRFTVMQARYLLRREGRTQKEVASQLCFDTVAHFNRYISTVEGVTPSKM